MISTHDSGYWKPLIAAVLVGLAGCSDPVADTEPLEQARLALASGDGIGAEIVLRDMIANGTDRAAVAAFLGEAELVQGQLIEARQWLAEGDFSDATRGHGFHMLARLEMREGNLPAAGQAFDQALSANRDNAELWVDIGRLRYRGGEQTQAVDASIHAVEIDPENPAALQFRAQLVRDAEGMQASLPWFERALKRNPESVELLADYAATLGELGRARDMLVQIRKIAHIDPGNRRIYYLQAVLAARAGKFDLARLLLGRSGRVLQDMPAAMLLSGVIDIENGNYASAAQTLERLQSVQPDNRRVRQLLARALFLGGNDREMVYRFGELARLPSASPYLRTLVGRSYEALDQRDRAAFFIDSAARMRSQNLIAVQSGMTLDVAEARGPSTGLDTLALVRARIVAGNPAAAIRAAEAFLERFPGSSDALSLAGDANLAARQYDRAARLYGQASLVRRPWPITRKLITAQQARGKNDEALVLLARYFVGDPGNIEAAGLLTREAARREDWNSAAIFADHALANGGVRDPMLLALRAQVALQLGDLDQAVEAAEAAYRLQPLNPVATRALALVYGEVDDSEALAEVLQAKFESMQN